jgi:type VI secretion system protein ImpE
MNAREHYEAGDLKAAIAAQTEEVKKHPADSARRGFLSELLCFSGEWERADKQLDLLGTQDPQAMVGIALFRHLLRAEQARQQFWSEGRLPEFLEQPSPWLRLHIDASIRLREGEPKEAKAMLAQAEEQRPKLHGTCDGQPFDDLRDLDDVTASFFEVLTSNGKYYWIPMERVESIDFREIVRPRDLLWRRVHMVVQGGPDGEVYLPTLYAGTHQQDDDKIRLGRATDWKSAQDGPIRGIGLRTFLIGSTDKTVLALQQLTITQP